MSSVRLATSGSKFSFAEATTKDVDQLFTLINTAYAVEKGSTGVAFKLVDRYPTRHQLAQDVAMAAADPNSVFVVARETPPTAVELAATSTAAAGAGGGGGGGSSSSTDILGCVRILVQSEPRSPEDIDRRLCEFGPFAVSPKAQGRGIGCALLAYVDKWARAKQCKTVQIDVVCHRSDILPYYRRRGFVETGIRPFYSNFDTSTVTRPTHFITMEKSLDHS